MTLRDSWRLGQSCDKRPAVMWYKCPAGIKWSLNVEYLKLKAKSKLLNNYWKCSCASLGAAFFVSFFFFFFCRKVGLHGPNNLLTFCNWLRARLRQPVTCLPFTLYAFSIRFFVICLHWGVVCAPYNTFSLPDAMTFVWAAELKYTKTHRRFLINSTQARIQLVVPLSPLLNRTVLQKWIRLTCISAVA